MMGFVMKDGEFCQSCGMPMEKNNELYGINNDGSKNLDYCSYCFKDGSFTADVNMEEMIEISVPHMVAANQGMTEDTAREMMGRFFPMLKRWQNK